jgi:hypothetical protein
MKSIINGKLYDMEKAKEIAYWQNMPNCTEFNWYCERLFVTTKRNYFLHGEGGAASRYAESGGGSSWGSEAIIALTDEEAFDWLAKHGHTDVALEHFPSMIEDA